MQYLFPLAPSVFIQNRNKTGEKKILKPEQTSDSNYANLKDTFLKKFKFSMIFICTVVYQVDARCSVLIDK